MNAVLTLFERCFNAGLTPYLIVGKIIASAMPPCEAIGAHLLPEKDVPVDGIPAELMTRLAEVPLCVPFIANMSIYGNNH